MDINQIIGQFVDPELAKYAFTYTGIDIEKLIPPHVNDANFSDVN